jgi:hypothetical protein
MYLTLVNFDLAFTPEIYITSCVADLFYIQAFFVTCCGPTLIKTCKDGLKMTAAFPSLSELMLSANF